MAGLVPKACMPAAAAAAPPPPPTIWRTWKPACSRAVGRRCFGLQHRSSSGTCSTRTTQLGISCQSIISARKTQQRGAHQQGSAASITWADAFHYHGSSLSTEDREGSVAGDAAGTGGALCYDGREGLQGSSLPHNAGTAGADIRGQGTMQVACYSSSSYRREGGSHQHSAVAGSRGQGADQDACLGRGERLVCVLAMAIPFAEGMLRWVLR